MNYVLPNNLLAIPTTLDVICRCWKWAENDMQQQIQQYYPDKHEEFVTELFHGRFAAALRAMSDENQIAMAFLNDLRSAYPDVQDTDLQKIATGLVADVLLHEKRTEKITGGDMGFMIIRPQIERSDNLVKIGDYRRGVLCQAKMKDKNGKWGHFTKKQMSVLPSRMNYLCLLLYSYKDRERRKLNNYQWHICKRDETLEHIVEYLKKDTFPQLVESDIIIQCVGHGLIGTDDEKILDEFISPKKNPSLVIRIFWPDGRSSGPGSYVYVYSSEQEHNIAYESEINTNFA
jgi:hypothetical protein